MGFDESVLAEVIAIVVKTLGIEDRAANITADTPLFGSIPELDSLGVVELLEALQVRFGIEIEDEDVTGEAFETIGTLTRLVEDHGEA